MWRKKSEAKMSGPLRIGTVEKEVARKKKEERRGGEEGRRGKRMQAPKVQAAEALS